MKINKNPAFSSSCFFVLIFLLALIPRLFLISKSYFGFHPTRQFHSANLAQAYLIHSQESFDPSFKKVAQTHLRLRGKKEPRIMEYLVSFTGRLTGLHSYWVPRFFSMLFWFSGGVFLFLLVQRLFSKEGAFFSTSLYLLFPFGINISRAFMPESLMIMFTLIALYFLFRHFHSSQTRPLLWAALFSGLAVLVKFVVIFPIFGAFAITGIQKHGLKKFVLNFQNLRFFVICGFLGIGYYVFILIYGSSFPGTIRDVFLPKMLLTVDFWRGWVIQIGNVTGWLPFLLGIAVLLYQKRSEARAFLAGILFGYGIYAFLFIYATAVIDYYHVALYLFVIIAMGQVGASAAEFVKQRTSGLKWISIAFGFCLLILFFFSVSTAHWTFLSDNFKRKLELPAAIFCGNQMSYIKPSEISLKVQKSEEIGEVVGHSAKTIFLADAYGFPLMFHGILFGKYWPDVGELRARQLQGETSMSAAERYRQDFAPWQADYFIVEDMSLWAKQPDLQDFLQNNFPLVEDGHDFLVYDLRKSADGIR